MGGKQRIMTLYSESDLDLPFGKNGKFSFQLGYTPVVSDMKKTVRKAAASSFPTWTLTVWDKLNVMSYTLATISRALVAVAGYMGSGNVTLMLLFTAIAALGQGPWQGDMNAVIAACSEYTWLTNHKRVDGTMYSCTSLGVKLGGGLGTAITGWLLAASHFDSALTVQPDSCINMLKIMYLVIPFALDAIITFLLSRMKVEEANEKLRAAV